MRVLVTGGARSGKSTFAEAMVTRWAQRRDAEGASGRAEQGLHHRPVVDYLATGYPATADDPDWAARVLAHQQRRPVRWRTIETLSVAEVLRTPSDVPLLVDCVGLWLTRTADETGAWTGEDDEVVARAADLIAAVDQTPRDVVLVTNEVGLGLVPDSEAGRWFRDALGRLNVGLAAACDEVWLCVAGIGMPVKHG